VDAGSFRLSVSARGVASVTPAGGVRRGANAAEAVRQALAYGTASGQFDRLYRASHTLAAGASVTLNLYDGSLSDVLGQTAPFRELRSVMVWVASGGDAAGVDVGSDGVVADPLPLPLKGTNPRVTVFPDGPPALLGSPAGVAVGTSTKNLKITNSGAVEAVVGVVLAGSTA
jgi:hypothetical protein